MLSSSCLSRVRKFTIPLDPELCASNRNLNFNSAAVQKVGGVAAVDAFTAAAPKVAEATAADTAAAYVASKAGDEGMGGVVVYSADAAWREVYNDADADSSDTDPDSDEMIDVGEEDWSTAASAMVTAAHSSSAAVSGEPAVEVAVETATVAAPATTGEHQYAQGGTAFGEGQEQGQDRAGAEAEREDASDVDSLQGEAFGVDALVANAMALADAAENDAEGLYGVGGGGYEGRVGDGEQFHTATTSASDKEYGSPLGSVRDVVTSGVFGSAKNTPPSWNEGEETDGGGDAEREAEEVQALVAEALALVKEANDDA